jgi:hypothetical protein
LAITAYPSVWILWGWYSYLVHPFNHHPWAEFPAATPAFASHEVVLETIINLGL